MGQNGLARVDEAGDAAWARKAPKRTGKPLIVGLVNNMPDAALSATEDQFRRLIASEASGRDVHLKLFSVPEIIRGEAARDAMRGKYASTDDLPASGVDALIVTGAEPMAADLRDEPYWPSLAALVDWAEANTVSAIWSCLAAHAAVLHLSGIKRRPLPAKCSGVFRVEIAATHPLLQNQASPLLVPHSRLNAVDEAELTAHGYKVLSHSIDIGVDTFMRKSASLFVFFQGHPEYSADSLMLEYRRDVRRFLRGERAIYPSVPVGYFDRSIENALTELAEKAQQDADPAILSACAKILADGAPAGHWMATTMQIYRNWLDLVADEAKTRLRV
jgi:homoserine O-succinyltransferase